MIRILEEDSIASKIASIFGTIISVGLNLTPGVLFYEFFKGKRELKTIPEMMFVSAVFCSSTNLAYGIIKGDTILILSNTICDILQVIYSTLFLFFYTNKKFSLWLLNTFIAWDLTFEVIYIFSNLLEFHTSKEFAIDFTGIFNIIIGLINVVTPGQNIIKVFKSEDFTLIPIVTICFQCLCSSFWGFYGFKDMDKMIIIPNFLGIMLTVIQIITYYYFYCKRKGIPPKNEDKEEFDENGKKEEKEREEKVEINEIKKEKEEEENQRNLISN